MRRGVPWWQRAWPHRRGAGGARTAGMGHGRSSARCWGAAVTMTLTRRWGGRQRRCRECGGRRGGQRLRRQRQIDMAWRWGRWSGGAASESRRQGWRWPVGARGGGRGSRQVRGRHGGAWLGHCKRAGVRSKTHLVPRRCGRRRGARVEGAGWAGECRCLGAAPVRRGTALPSHTGILSPSEGLKHGTGYWS